MNLIKYSPQMKNLIHKIIETEASALGVSETMFREYVEKGCLIAYKNTFDDLTDSLVNLSPDEDELRNLILVCAYGGMIDSNTFND